MAYCGWRGRHDRVTSSDASAPRLLDRRTAAPRSSDNHSYKENTPMSDPQQPAPPSYYATTRLPETDLPPPPPAKRGRGWLYAAIGAVLVIAIGVGFAVVLGRTLFQAQRSIPRLVGEDTQFYMSLTPNLSAVQGVQRLQAAYPQLFLDKDSSGVDKQLEEALGVTFKEDIQPWLGREMALAV